MQNDYDVMVIGGGGAGMAAAISAAENGARVCLLEVSDRLGGSTALSGGIFYVGGTRQQREIGIEDKSTAMADEILAVNPATPRDVVDSFCREAVPTFEWLQSIGVQFPSDRVASPSGRTVPRAHEPEGFGMAIAEKLDHELHRHPVDVAMKARVDRLVTNDTGRVIGAEIDGAIVSSSSVIIASGSIGANADLVRRLLPKTRLIEDWVWYIGPAQNRGDGVVMASDIGAQVAGFDSALLLNTPRFFLDFEVIGPEWLPLVNEAGNRFVAEDGGYWEISEAVERQPNAHGWAIFDERLLNEKAVPHPRVVEALKTGGIKLSWITEMLREQLEKGTVKTAPDLAGLAQQVGIDPGGLEQGIAQYNDLVATGKDTAFGKLPHNLHHVGEPPFYAVEVRPAMLVVTGAGLCIDGRAQVLDDKGEPIAGLYAAGETTGNVFGRYYVGSGYALATALTYGRIAGREAALAPC